MMREIGSEFWSVPTVQQNNGFFPEDTRWFLSGRSALTCILEDIRKHTPAKTAALPAWCCDSMIKPFADMGFSLRFYSVYPENGRLVQDFSAAEGADVWLVMDYFGYTGPLPPRTDAIVIRDLTHSIFSLRYDDAQYCFGSLRKWAGFYTGGFAWGLAQQNLPENEGYVAMRSDAMAQKEQYILGNSSGKGYLAVCGEAEELLEDCPLAGAAQRDILLAQKLDIACIRDRRRENAAILLEAFSDVALFPTLREGDCPLFVPILVPDGKRDELRKRLIQKEIYCPVHWPLTQYHKIDRRSAAIYENELSLVCDQRYGANHMERIIETVKNFWKD